MYRDFARKRAERRSQRQPERRRQFGWVLPAQDRTSIYIDDLAGHEVGQVRSHKEDGAGDFFGGGGAAERNYRGGHLLARFGLEDRNGHVGGDPAGGDRVHQNIVTGELGRKTFGEADDAAFGSAVVGVERFAPLPGGGADGDDFAGLLLDHLRDGEVDDGVDALEIDADHVVPLLFGHLLDGGIFEVPNAGVGYENIQAAETGDGVLDKFLIVGMLADVGFERFHASAVLASFLLDLKRGVLGFDVVENHVGAGLREEFDGGRADAARTAGDECRLACERNHETPESRNSKIETRNLKLEQQLAHDW